MKTTILDLLDLEKQIILSFWRFKNIWLDYHFKKPYSINSWSTKESEMQYLDAVSKMTE